MANKRKRDDLGDSNPDEITPGKQILPVANLPHDFNQEPQDGMQYLFLVRRDARRLPHVTRVRNPYEVSETKVMPTSTPLPTNVLPCEEWRIAFQTHFSNLKKNLAQATIHGHSGPKRRVIPEKKDRDAWWKFLAGYPESVWSPGNRSSQKELGMSRRRRPSADPTEVVHHGHATTLPCVQSGDEPSHSPIAYFNDLSQHVLRQLSSRDIPRTADSMNSTPFAVDPLIYSVEDGEEHIGQFPPLEVTPSHLREIDHQLSIHLLMYFTHWINVHLQDPSDLLTTISVSHGRWMFALLTKVDDQLSADEMHRLRNLARACLGLVQMYKEHRAKNNAALEGISSPTPIENNLSDASYWMVFAAIAGYWGQRDLWADAETALASA